VRAFAAGLKADFSTANPTSAYDTANFGKVRFVPEFLFLRHARLAVPRNRLCHVIFTFLCDLNDVHDDPLYLHPSTQSPLFLALLDTTIHICVCAIHIRNLQITRIHTFALACMFLRLAIHFEIYMCFPRAAGEAEATSVSCVWHNSLDLACSNHFRLQVEIFNKDVLKNPITGEGPEIAGKKTIAAAEKRADTPSYASQVRKT